MPMTARYGAPTWLLILFETLFESAVQRRPAPPNPMSVTTRRARTAVTPAPCNGRGHLIGPVPMWDRLPARSWAEGGGPRGRGAGVVGQDGAALFEAGGFTVHERLRRRCHGRWRRDRKSVV